ncbi:MAG: phosphatase PAP2 family protein, partial [Acidobacteria bacterium]|nr:phosphatase PAP2 family protein [Acidobacteriota bacterium]
SGAIHFARHWYPFALFIFFFEELHYLVQLIFPGWFDRWLIAFDFSLFGTHPTVWLERFGAPATNDLMAFFYLTYYLYTVVLAGVLYAKKEVRAFWIVMTATATAYVMGYFIALAFPVEGPYHTLRALQQGPLEGGAVTALMGFIQRFGRVHGAAFPSLHVAGAFVALLGARQFARRLFWIFLPLFAAMCVSTVYGRYHYVADVFGGLVVGAVGFWIAERWEARNAKEVEEVEEEV